MNDTVNFGQPKHDLGFSLIEMLTALAILSLISLALFQSTQQILSVATKASGASDALIEDSVARKTFKLIVSGLVPGWIHQEDTVFKGSADGFSGLSGQIPSEAANGFKLIAFSLASISENETSLLVKISNSPSFELSRFGSGEVYFEYLGNDRVFYSEWPPQRPLGSEGYSTPSDLPKLVRLNHMSQGAPESIWFATIDGSLHKPFRDNFSRIK